MKDRQRWKNLVDKGSRIKYGERTCSCDAVAEFMAYARMTVVQDGAAGNQEPDKEFRELILSISRDKEERRGQERG